LAHLSPEQVVSWDLHATATPGDFQEVENLQTIVSKHTLVSARKGTFGHGMGVGGGWELTAQYMGMARGKLYATTLQKSDLHPSISALEQEMVLDKPVPVSAGPVGKLSMGVGGINACVVSRPFEDE
jgi:3-oxoacyl-(acyl-carrier-protein) synthase